MVGAARSANDIGDAPAPGYWRAGLGMSRGQPVLPVLRRCMAGALRGRRRRRAARGARGSGVPLRADAIHVRSAPPTMFLVAKLDGKNGAAFKAAPKAELPRIDRTTGTLVPWPAFTP